MLVTEALNMRADDGAGIVGEGGNSWLRRWKQRKDGTGGDLKGFMMQCGVCALRHDGHITQQ